MEYTLLRFGWTWKLLASTHTHTVEHFCHFQILQSIWHKKKMGNALHRILWSIFAFGWKTVVAFSEPHLYVFAANNINATTTTTAKIDNFTIVFSVWAVWDLDKIAYQKPNTPSAMCEWVSVYFAHYYKPATATITPPPSPNWAIAAHQTTSYNTLQINVCSVAKVYACGVYYVSIHTDIHRTAANVVVRTVAGYLCQRQNTYTS